jgi:hypothetical protein
MAAGASISFRERYRVKSFSFLNQTICAGYTLAIGVDQLSTWPAFFTCV